MPARRTFLQGPPKGHSGPRAPASRSGGFGFHDPATALRSGTVTSANSTAIGVGTLLSANSTAKSFNDPMPFQLMTRAGPGFLVNESPTGLSAHRKPRPPSSNDSRPADLSAT
eukprot:10432827-Karenia_brevis.AAC.1